MAISKIIYKSSAEDTGTVWMDTTQKTVTAGSMLNGTTALKNDGTDITGNIATKTSANLTASGATVTAQAGYYAESASKSVASGSEGTPTATKGTVSNHAVTVTPSVTNTAGYISGGTHTGTGVSVSVSELESGTKEITSNGTGISVSGYSKVDVSVTPSLQAKSNISPTTSSQTISADNGYDGLSSVQINAMPSGSATAPATISGSSATVSTGTNTLTLSKTVSVTPSVTAGYVSSGTAGNSAVSLTASVNTRSSSDLSASTLTVTAPAGYYASDATKTLTDANLLATNIKKNISIFGVTGSYEGSGGGSSGLEYEAGTYTPASDTTSITISFTNTHSEPPFYYMFSDADSNVMSAGYTSIATIYSNSGQIFGSYSISNAFYGQVSRLYSGNANPPTGNPTQTISYLVHPYTDSESSNTSYSRYWTTETQFKVESTSTRYWRSGRTYKWIAVWKPST